MILTWPHALHTLRLVLPRLHTRQPSLSVTFSIKTHNRCISILSNTQAKSYRADAQILSGARSFAARMHWRRMQSNAFGRLHSNDCGHDWAIATDVTKIRWYSPGGMHCSLDELFEAPPANRNHGQAPASKRAKGYWWRWKKRKTWTPPKTCSRWRALAVEYMPGGSNLVLRTTFIEKATPRCLLEKTFSSVGKRLLDA